MLCKGVLEWGPRRGHARSRWLQILLLLFFACVQDLVISAYIPEEYQQTILSRCRWEDGQQRWAVDHIEWWVVRGWGRQAGRPGCG